METGSADLRLAPSNSRARAGDKSGDENHHDRAKYGYEQTLDIEPGDVNAHERADDPAADNGAEDTQNDIAKYAVTTSFDQNSGEPAGNKTWNYPTQNTHLMYFFSVVWMHAAARAT